MLPSTRCPAYLLLLLIFFITCAACTRPVQYIYYEEELSDVYLSGFPVGNAAPYLEEMQRSVKRISSTTYYEIHRFNPADRVQPGDIENRRALNRLSIESSQDRRSTSGTAIVIHNRENLIGLLTTSHIISTPDTLYEYTDDSREYLLSATIKTDQVTWLMNYAALGSLEVLATDPITDLAILGAEANSRELGSPANELFPKFPYPFGDPQRLQPGAFLYALGFPRGYPVVTSGIVSTTNYGRHHSFVTDMLFNPGFSGGAIVAVRGGIPTFELMGIARSASGTGEWVLVPEEETPEVDPHLRRPYTEGIYLQRKTRIDYGITHVISATDIKRFLDDNSSRLARKGFRIHL